MAEVCLASGFQKLGGLQLADSSSREVDEPKMETKAHVLGY